MSELPPPTGSPVAYALRADPWAEQARRHAAHQAERRARHRRQLLRFGVPAVLVALLGVGAAARLFVASDDEPTAAPPTTLAHEAAQASQAAQDGANEVPDPSSGAASVDEVWLLDRGNGVYDWGALLSSGSDVVRRDLDVSVRLLDVAGDEVRTEATTIAELAPGGQVVVGGVVEVADGSPARIEVTATLGTAVDDAVAAVIDVVDLRRVSSGQVGSDDRLLGTVDVIDGDPGAATLAAIWRDASGGVVASVVDVIELESDGRPTDFSLRLPRAVVPAGAPDDIVASSATLN